MNLFFHLWIAFSYHGKGSHMKIKLCYYCYFLFLCIQFPWTITSMASSHFMWFQNQIFISTFVSKPFFHTVRIVQRLRWPRTFFNSKAAGSDFKVRRLISSHHSSDSPVHIQRTLMLHFKPSHPQANPGKSCTSTAFALWTPQSHTHANQFFIPLSWSLLMWKEEEIEVTLHQKLIGLGCSHCGW